METLIAGFALVVISALLYLLRQKQQDNEQQWEIWTQKNSTIPPASTEAEQEVEIPRLSPPPQRRRRPITMDQIDITSMTTKQLNDFLDPKQQQGHLTTEEATRIASLDPTEVVYLNDEQWFDPHGCEMYPSKSNSGTELMMTLKGTWILKQESTPGEYDYQVVSKKNAFIFLESNGYKEIAESLAPHNPRNEL